MSTEEKFKAAVNVIRSLPKHGSYQPSTDMQLKFYSFYKQATEGPCNSPKPSFWDVVGKAKWDAWKNLGDMAREEAMEKYVDELKQIIETMSYTENVAKFIDMLGPFYEVIPLEKAAFNGDITPENDALVKGVPTKTGRRVNGYGQGDEEDSDRDEFSDTYDHVHEENGTANGNPSRLFPRREEANEIWALNSTESEVITQARGGAGSDLGAGGLGGRSGNTTLASNRSVRPRQGRDSSGAQATDASNPSGSGGGGSGGGQEGGRGMGMITTVDEQLALAVIKLQHTLDQVNARLAVLESSLKRSQSKGENDRSSIWTLLGVSPRFVVLVLVWPFVVHWLIHVSRRRK